MANNEIEQSFIADTKDHIMTILSDDGGVNRRIMFSNNGSSVYQYTIHTWTGHLMVTGDMGTYVFKRIDDMFDFFDTQSSNYKINTGYWAEKLIAINSNCGQDASIKKYIPALFETMIKECFDDWVEGYDVSNEDKTKAWKSVQEDVLCHAEDEYTACMEAYNFSYKGLNFYDESFDSCKEYTYHYVWILYAIVDGINQYIEGTHANTSK